MISAEIDPADMAKLRRTIEEAAGKLKLSSRDLVRQAAIFAIQSAAKETGPGTASSPKKMPVQYKFRKIVKYSGSNGFRYAYRTKAGKEGMFVTRKQISKKSKEKRGLRDLKRNIEVWDRKKRVTRMIPYLGTATGKYDKVSRIGKIPHYGAAKVGWLKALGRIPGGKPEKQEGEQFIPTPRVSVEKSRDTYGLTIENLVEYVDKISPNAAAVAMKKTANRMERIYQKRIEQLEKKINL